MQTEENRQARMLLYRLLGGDHPQYKHEAYRQRELLRRRAKKYGLREEDFLKLLLSQDGRCAICKKMSQPSTDLHIDHCHQSGKVRGLLCSGCNMAIGRLGDSLEYLRSAYEYLRRHYEGE